MQGAGPFVVATDFSPLARHAAHRAARLARGRDAALALVHVLPGEALGRLRGWLGGGSAAERQIFDEARAQLQAKAATLRAAFDVPVREHLAQGEPIDEVLRLAEELSAAALVLGARGTGYLRRMVLGSTAERLLRRTSRPLLVVRQPPHEPYRRALVAVDFSRWTLPAVALARAAAPGAKLVLLSAYQVPFEGKLHFAGVDRGTVEHYREQARLETTRAVHALAATCGLGAGQWEPCVLEGEASLRIVEQEQERDCDLVVLGKHGTSAAVDLLLGSVTRHVLAEGVADVLVSPASVA